MPVTALWPRSRRERTLAARCLRLADALRVTAAERDAARRKASDAIDTLRWLLAESEWHREHANAWAVATIAGRKVPCDYDTDPGTQHRLLHAQADALARAQREIGALEATIARLRPRPLRAEGP